MPTLQKRYTKVLTKEREYVFRGELPTDNGVEEVEIKFRFRKLRQRDYMELLGKMRGRSRQWEKDRDLLSSFSEMVDPPSKDGLIEDILRAEGLFTIEFDNIQEEVINALTEAKIRVGAVGNYLDTTDIGEKLDKLLSEAHSMDVEDYRTTFQLEGEPDEGVVERHLKMEKANMDDDIEMRRKELEGMKTKELSELWTKQRYDGYVQELATAYFVHSQLVKEVYVQEDGEWVPALEDAETVMQDLPRPLYNFLMDSHQDFNGGFVDLEELAMYSPFRSIMGTM